MGSLPPGPAAAGASRAPEQGLLGPPAPGRPGGGGSFSPPPKRPRPPLPGRPQGSQGPFGQGQLERGARRPAGRCPGPPQPGGGSGPPDRGAEGGPAAVAAATACVGKTGRGSGRTWWFSPERGGDEGCEEGVSAGRGAGLCPRPLFSCRCSQGQRGLPGSPTRPEGALLSSISRSPREEGVSARRRRWLLVFPEQG